jgi:hypothetical protein
MSATETRQPLLTDLDFTAKGRRCWNSNAGGRAPPVARVYGKIHRRPCNTPSKVRYDSIMTSASIGIPANMAMAGATERACRRIVLGMVAETLGETIVP